MTTNSKSKTEKNLEELWQNCLAGSFCTSFSVALFNPMDTLRIRWQVAGATQQQKGIWQFYRGIVNQEGFFRGLWIPGCVAHSSAVAISSGIRLGFYPTIRDLLVGDDEEGKKATHMAAAGFIAGAFGFYISNPFFQAKVRLQADLEKKNLGKGKPTYSSMTNCLKKIYAEEGVSGLFRGSSTLLLRGALLSSGAQLGYDWTKTHAKRNDLLQDGPVLHFIGSIASAFLASVFASPCDLIMTRYQSAPLMNIQYRGVWDCVKTIVYEEGVFSLYRGFNPLFFRLAPLWMFNMPFYEFVRKNVFGLDYMQ